MATESQKPQMGVSREKIQNSVSNVDLTNQRGMNRGAKGMFFAPIDTDRYVDAKNVVKDMHIIDPLDVYTYHGPEEGFISRYPNYRPYWSEFDWADNQTKEEVRSNMWKQFYQNWQKSFFGGFESTAANIGNILEGNFGELVVNDPGRLAGYSMAAASERYPIYQSREMAAEDESRKPGFISSVKTYLPGGADPGRRWAQLWGSSGFTVGTLSQVAVEEVALGAATALSGGAAAPLAALRTGMNMNKARKALKLMFSAGENITKVARNASKANKAKAVLKNFGKAGFYTARMANLASFEASMEAGMIELETQQEGIQHILDTKGRAPTSEEMQEINELAAKRADFTFGWNMPLLTFTNLLVIPNIIKPAMPGKLAVKGLIPKTVFRGGKYKALGDAVKDGMQKTMGKRLGGLTYHVGKYTSRGLKTAIPEGFEEMAQGWGVETAKKIYDPVNNEYGDTWTEMMRAAGDSVSESLGSQAGWDEFTAGAIMGLGFGGLGGGFQVAKRKITGGKTQLEQSRELAEMQNNAMDEFVQNHMFSTDNVNAATQTQLAAEIQKAEAEGDTKRVKDLRAEARTALFNTMHRAGRGQDFVNDMFEVMDIMKEENPTALENLLGGRTIEETKQELMDQYNAYSKDMDMYINAFGLNENMDSNEFAATYTAAHVLASAGTKLRDGEARVETIRRELDEAVMNSQDGKDADKAFKIRELFDALMDPSKLPQAISSVTASLETNRELLKNSQNEAEKEALATTIRKQEEYLGALTTVGEQIFDENGNISDNYDADQAINTILNQAAKIAPSAVNEAFVEKAKDLMKLNAENANLTFFQNVLLDENARKRYAEAFVEGRETAKAENALSKAKRGNRYRGVNTDIARSESITTEELDEIVGDDLTAAESKIILDSLGKIKQNKATGKYSFRGSKDFDTLEEAQDAVIESLSMDLNEKNKTAFKKAANGIAKAKQNPKKVEKALAREQPHRKKLEEAKEKAEAKEIQSKTGVSTVERLDKVVEDKTKQSKKLDEDIEKAEKQLEETEKALKKEKDSEKKQKLRSKKNELKGKIDLLEQQQRGLKEDLAGLKAYRPFAERLSEKVDAIQKAQESGDVAAEAAAIEEFLQAKEDNDIVPSDQMYNAYLERAKELQSLGYVVESPQVGEDVTPEMRNNFEVKEETTEDLPDGITIVKEVEEPRVTYDEEGKEGLVEKKKGKVVVVKGIGKPENFETTDKQVLVDNYLDNVEQKTPQSPETTVRQKIENNEPLNEEEQKSVEALLEQRKAQAKGLGPKDQNEIDREASRLTSPSTKSTVGSLAIAYDYAYMKLLNSKYNLDNFLANSAGRKLQDIYAAIREEGPVIAGVIHLNDKILNDKDITIIDIEGKSAEAIAAQVNRELGDGLVVLKDGNNRLHILSRNTRTRNFLQEIQSSLDIYREPYSGVLRESNNEGKVIGSTFNEGQFTAESKVRVGELRIGDTVQIRLASPVTNQYNKELLDAYERDPSAANERKIFDNLVIEVVSNGVVVGVLRASDLDGLANESAPNEGVKRAQKFREKIFTVNGKVDVVARIGQLRSNPTSGVLAGSAKVSGNFIKRTVQKFSGNVEESNNKQKTEFTTLEEFERMINEKGQSTVDFYVATSQTKAVNAKGETISLKDANRELSPFRQGGVYVMVKDNVTGQVSTTQAATIEQIQMDELGTESFVVRDGSIALDNDDIQDADFKKRLVTNLDASTGRPIVSTQIFVDENTFSTEASEITHDQSMSDKYNAKQSKGNINVVQRDGTQIPLTDSELDLNNSEITGKGPDGNVTLPLGQIQGFQGYNENVANKRPEGAPQTKGRKEATAAIQKLKNLAVQELTDANAVKIAGEVYKLESLQNSNLQLNEDEQKILKEARASLDNAGYSTQSTEQVGAVLDAAPEGTEPIPDATIPEGQFVVKEVKSPAVTKGNTIVQGLGRGQKSGKPKYVIARGTKKNTELQAKSEQLQKAEQDLTALQNQQREQQGKPAIKPATEQQKAGVAKRIDKGIRDANKATTTKKKAKALQNIITNTTASQELYGESFVTAEQQAEIDRLTQELADEGAQISENVQKGKEVIKGQLVQIDNFKEDDTLPIGTMVIEKVNTPELRDSDGDFVQQGNVDVRLGTRKLTQAEADAKIAEIEAQRERGLNTLQEEFHEKLNQELDDNIAEVRKNTETAPTTTEETGPSITLSEEEQKVVDSAQKLLDKKEGEIAEIEGEIASLEEQKKDFERVKDADNAQKIENQLRAKREALQTAEEVKAYQEYKIANPSAELIFQGIKLEQKKLAREKVEQGSKFKKQQRLNEVNELLDELDPIANQIEAEQRKFDSLSAKDKTLEKELENKRKIAALRLQQKEERNEGKVAERIAKNAATNISKAGFKSQITKLFPDLAGAIDNVSSKQRPTKTAPVKEAAPAVSQQEIEAKQKEVSDLQNEVSQLKQKLRAEQTQKAQAKQSNASKLKPSRQEKALENSKEISDEASAKQQELEQQLQEVSDTLQTTRDEFTRLADELQKLEDQESISEADQEKIDGLRRELELLRKERRALNESKSQVKEGTPVSEQEVEVSTTKEYEDLKERRAELEEEIESKKKQKKPSRKESNALKRVQQREADKAKEEKREPKELTIEDINEEIRKLGPDSGLQAKVNDIFRRYSGDPVQIGKELRKIESELRPFLTKAHKDKNLELNEKNKDSLFNHKKGINSRITELELAKKALNYQTSQQELAELEKEYKQVTDRLDEIEKGAQDLGQELITDEDIALELDAIQAEESAQQMSNDIQDSQPGQNIDPHLLFGIDESATVEEVHARWAEINAEGNYGIKANTMSSDYLEMLFAYMDLLDARGAKDEALSPEDLLLVEQNKQLRLQAIEQIPSLEGKQAFIVQYGRPGDVFTMPDGTTYEVIRQTEEEEVEAGEQLTLNFDQPASGATVTISKAGYGEMTLFREDGSLAEVEQGIDRQEVEDNPPSDLEIIQIIEKEALNMTPSGRDAAIKDIYEDRVSEMREKMRDLYYNQSRPDKFGLSSSMYVMAQLGINMQQDLILMVEKYTDMVKNGETLPSNLRELMREAGLSEETMEAYIQNLSSGAYASIWAFATQADILIGEEKSILLREVVSDNVGVLNNEISRLERLDATNMTAAAYRQALGIPRRIIEEFFDEQSLYIKGTDVIENLSKEGIIDVLASIRNFAERVDSSSGTTSLIGLYTGLARDLALSDMELNLSSLLLLDEGKTGGVGRALIFNDSVNFLSEFNDVEMSAKAILDMFQGKDVVGVKDEHGHIREIDTALITDEVISREEVQNDIKFVNSILSDVEGGLVISPEYIAASHIANGNADGIVSRVLDSRKEIDQIVRYRDFTNTNELKPTYDFLNRETEEKEVENQICK